MISWLTVMRRQATPLIMKGFPVNFTLSLTPYRPQRKRKLAISVNAYGHNTLMWL